MPFAEDSVLGLRRKEGSWVLCALKWTSSFIRYSVDSDLEETMLKSQLLLFLLILHTFNTELMILTT